MKNTIKILLGLTLAVIGFQATTANALAILCENTALNHMSIDDTQVAACVDAGTGNIGNAGNDDFLNAGGAALGYSILANDIGGWTQTVETSAGSAGTWDVSAISGIDAIGFKFGTGNEPDEWFIFDLLAGVTSGDWEFINVFGKGGGLSHMTAYTKDANGVPEPGMVVLLAIGLLGMVVARCRTKV